MCSAGSGNLGSCISHLGRIPTSGLTYEASSLLHRQLFLPVLWPEIYPRTLPSVYRGGKFWSGVQKRSISGLWTGLGDGQPGARRHVGLGTPGQVTQDRPWEEPRTLCPRQHRQAEVGKKSPMRGQESKPRPQPQRGHTSLPVTPSSGLHFPRT